MKLNTIIVAVSVKEYVNILAPFFNLNFKWIIKKTTVNSKGINAGNNIKLSVSSPFVNDKKER